jgi:tetratricopeptide (TPR) repeat protein
MKRITKILLLVAVAMSTAMTASAQIKVKASDYISKDAAILDLQSHRGKVIVAFDVEIGEKFIKSNQRCVITPMFVNGSFEEKLLPVILEGKKYALLAREQEKFDKIAAPDNFKRVVYNGKGAAIHYQVDIPYVSQYKGATLVLKYEVYKVCGKRVSEHSTNLAKGVTSYADFIQKGLVVYYIPNTLYKTYVNDFANSSVFRQGKTTIDFSVFRANGYDDLVAEVKRLDEDKDSSILKVKVETSASPEGPLHTNARLAENRSEAIQKQLVRDLGIDESLITREWIDENWDAFLEELPDSGLGNVGLVRQIIDLNDDLDKREAELKKLGNYSEIYKIFQNLRNCKVTIDYSTRESLDRETTIDGKTYGAIRLGKNNPEISLQTSRKYFDENSTDATANNMMVALMAEGQYGEALRYADMIPDKDICPVIANNKAVLYMYLDEPDMSAAMFELAGRVPMANYNEGLILLIEGENEESVALPASANQSTVVATKAVEKTDVKSIENAAKKSTKKADKAPKAPKAPKTVTPKAPKAPKAAKEVAPKAPKAAKEVTPKVDKAPKAPKEVAKKADKAVEKSPNAQAAEKYYRKAIAYAKDGKQKSALDALEKAIEKDASYKEKAANQAELAPYKTVVKFTQLTK